MEVSQIIGDNYCDVTMHGDGMMIRNNLHIFFVNSKLSVFKLRTDIQVAIHA